MGSTNRDVMKIFIYIYIIDVYFDLNIINKCIFYFMCFLRKKTLNTYSKLEIYVVCRETFAFKYVFIFFSKQIR